MGITFDEFVKAYLGKSTDYDGVSGVQCVDLVKVYMNKVFGMKPGAWGNAKDYYENFSNVSALKNNFTRIANTPSFVPQKGDICVWGKNVSSSHNYGHIAIATGEGNTKEFYTYDQNWNGKPMKKVKHTYAAFLGVLRPNNQTAITRQTSNAASAASTSYQYYDKDTNQIIAETQTSSDSVSISYRGIENPFGNTFKWIQGVNFWGNGNMAGGQAYICDDFNFADNKNNDNYSPVGFTIMNTEIASDYISAFGYGNEKYDWTFLATEINGTSALPIGDKAYGTVHLNSFATMNAGGAWNSINAAGIFSHASNLALNYRNCHVGCRLIYLPQ